MKKVIYIISTAAVAVALCHCNQSPAKRTFSDGNFEVATPMSEV